MSEEWQGKPALFCLSGKLGQVSFAWVQMSLVTVQESGGAVPTSPLISLHPSACSVRLWTPGLAREAERVMRWECWSGHEHRLVHNFKHSEVPFGALIGSGWGCSSFCCYHLCCPATHAAHSFIPPNSLPTGDSQLPACCLGSSYQCSSPDSSTVSPASSIKQQTCPPCISCC